MKILFSEIFRVYKKAPIKITFIWLLDVLESLIIISDPYIIGNCIDGLLKKDFFWLVILIIINIVFWLSQTTNNSFDTRIYSHIIEDENYCYYSKMIQTDADSSLISARLDLIDEIPNFLEIDFFKILNIIGGIAVSLLFLYFNSTLFVFSFAMEEERMNQISGRDKLAYKRYIQNLLKISISNSDLDTKIFFVTNFLQMMLLFFSILSITNISNFTSGLLFSTVTYIEMLNGYVSDINGNLILLNDLKETTYRLKEETCNELQK